MSEYNHLSEAEAIRKLAGYTEAFVRRFSKLAISYNINIITGSMPEIVNNNLYNVGYLCKRDGGVERYEKLHITPDEAKVWGMQGGNKIQSFKTDCGKVGILICYDVEFPENVRRLAQSGVQLVLVPTALPAGDHAGEMIGSREASAACSLAPSASAIFSS